MIDRIPTGCVGLDEILNGGIPANTITVLMGAPGTGKTILAEGLAFSNATEARPALYLTTLSEPLEKFIFHGQRYSFFDPEKVGKSVIYEDLGMMVRETGIEKLAEVVADLIMKYKPAFLFIDSFKSLNELIQSTLERRTVIYDLATVLTAYQCTTFLIGEYSDAMTTDLPEFAIADVVLNMMKYSTNVREQRFLRVEKLRGSNSTPGMHAFSINDQGIRMYPRLLSPTAAPTYEPKVERVNSGIGGLDEMIDQGFWRGSTTMVAGPSGSGKTIMALSFIREGALRGEPGLYVGFQENPSQMARIMLNLGWSATELLEGGNFELMYRSPVEMQLDSVAAEVFQRVRAGQAKRVVIDALGDLERCSMDRQRFADFIYALTQWFAVENVTCLMTTELRELFEVGHISDQEISNMSDNLVLLGFTRGEEMKRTIRIIKTRGSTHDNRQHFLEINDKGAVVGKSK
ncbi:MAG TPA: ATPase domain-containing protein [Pyrinomonadaceae bacterium]|jgi:circadian clock protein KaiC|nr:ATPase domain-containing protein [Pyrinomonadaceae bacterium]